MTRIRLIAAICCICMAISHAYSQAQSPEQEPTPCQVFAGRLGVPMSWPGVPVGIDMEGVQLRRIRWWHGAAEWPELDPLPPSAEVRWEEILEIAATHYANSYYLVSHTTTARCYVAVCGGFANFCSFYSPPLVDDVGERL